MIINKHVWARGATNEYCVHCGLIFESDLGWTSADGVKCKDRLPTKLADVPDDVRSYANFTSLCFDNRRQVFIKAYSETEYTIKQLCELVESLKLTT